MDKKTEDKVRIINKTFESIKRDNKSLTSVSLIDVAQELSMPLEELTSFFLTVEDIYFNEQQRNNRKTEEYLESGLGKQKSTLIQQRTSHLKFPELFVGSTRYMYLESCV